MPDYNKGCIYMIKHNLDYNNENVYIGSCCNFTRRKCAHKTVCNNPSSVNHTYKLYQTIRENGGWDNWVMIKLHNFPCNEKYQLKLEERRVIDEYKSKLNTTIPTRTIKEWCEDNKEYINEKQKKYYEEHKEERNEYAKKYRENNKEKISEKKKKYYENNKELNKKITCECGAIVRKDYIAKHRKTKKHISFFNNTEVDQHII